MKKNIILVFSMLLIISMFLSMAYVAFFGKNDTLGVEEVKGDIEQHLKLNIGAEPQTIHPGLVNDYASEIVVLQTFEGLTRIDQWGQRVNAAASSIKISDDQKTYWFTLRDSKWSNGDTVIAKDFEYSWKWLLDPVNKSDNAYQLYLIEGAQAFNKGKGSRDDVGIKAIDDKTLEVSLVEPNPNFLELISLNSFFPINSKIAENNLEWADEAGENYIVNGPYIIDKWDHNNKIVLAKNQQYWDKGMVNLKQITMYMVNDPNVKSIMFDNGDLNWGGSSTDELFEEEEQVLLVDELPKTQSILGLNALKINTEKVPFNNKNIRKALSFAINRQLLTENTTQMGDITAMSVIPPWLFPEKENGYFKDNDVENAKKYLDTGLNELGYQNASQLPAISIAVSSNENDIMIAENVQKMWKEQLGITINIIRADWNIHYNKVKDLDYDIALINISNDFNNPVVYLESIKNMENNHSDWDNKAFLTLLEENRIELDKESRLRLLKEAETELMEEMPIIPISFYTIEFLKGNDLVLVSESRTGNFQFKWALFE